jgi:phosphate transport system protein
MSPADSAEPVPARLHFSAELQELRLQTEMMGVLVDQNLERTRAVLATGDLDVAERAVAADDGIDAMNVSLTEQCYEVLRRESPVAADLRLVVSVVRVTAAFERVGDLCLRIVKLAPEHDLIASNPVSFDILQAMADLAVDHFRTGLRAWAADDADLARLAAEQSPEIDLDMDRLTENLIGLTGPDAARLALRSLVVGHSLQRISDHASVMGRRVQYLLSGDHRYLAAEVR